MSFIGDVNFGFCSAQKQGKLVVNNTYKSCHRRLQVTLKIFLLPRTRHEVEHEHFCTSTCYSVYTVLERSLQFKSLSGQLTIVIFILVLTERQLQLKIVSSCHNVCCSKHLPTNSGLHSPDNVPYDQYFHKNMCYF